METKIYYVDKSKLANSLIFLLSTFYNIKIQKLEFQLRKIKSSKGELERFIINRKTAFKIIDAIKNSDSYRYYINSDLANDRIEDYINKRLLEGYVNSKSFNIPKLLYLIKVVSKHNQCHSKSNAVLIISNRPWKSVLKQYAMDCKVELIFAKNFSLINYFKRKIIFLIKKTPRIFVYIQNVVRFRLRYKRLNTPIVKIYLEGRGSINFNNKLGSRSDFFILNHSTILQEQIAYKWKTLNEKNLLDESKIFTISGFTRFHKQKIHLQNFFNNPKRKQFKREYHELDYLINEYKADRAYWYSMYKNYNIKIHNTWFDNNADHMAIADAIKDYGGIATMYQTSFYGFKNYECKTNTDIMFHFSKFDSEMNQSLGSNNSYNIVTGLITDYIGKDSYTIAVETRNKLKSAGAKNIVNIMDENCSFDPRWHTGPELQIENYSIILQKLLETPWLGVVFKPKKVSTIKQKLEPINELLLSAIKTGRCIILDESGSHVSNMSPILGSMIADVSVHGHLFAGTAALECALFGGKTILIDREGAMSSKLYELSKEDVIFNNWNDAIEEIIKYFKNDNANPKFGDWSTFIKAYNPFQDNNGAYRMATYIQNLLNGFERGMDRETIMANVAQQYADRWGYNMVIENTV